MSVVEESGRDRNRGKYVVSQGLEMEKEEQKSRSLKKG
jgi:hypothetical protein